MGIELPHESDRRFFHEKRTANDVSSVMRAASLLSVGEFRVFEIAYEQWYGEPGDAKQIERCFAAYMFNDIIPVWVRHFCTKVVQLDSEDALDPGDYGILAPAASTRQQNRVLECIMLLIVILMLFFSMGESAADFMQLQ
jgi:hypothetical protein